MVPAPITQPSPRRILVVEDEVLIRMVVADELREAGFEVVEAGHAGEALAHLNAEDQVDLVFSDIHMPGELNGRDLARVLTDQFPRLPVILTSANRGPHASDDHFSFVAKPYRNWQVIATINRMLD